MNPEVLIVGAGPVGLTAALALARAGIGIRILDTGNGIDPRMRASTFHPPTLDMLDALGVASGLVEEGLKVPRWQMRQHDSGEFVEFDLNLIADKTVHPYRLQLEQQRYCAVAIEALSELGVEVEFSRRIDSVQQSSTRATAKSADGECIVARWIIGADGANSAVRKSLGLEYGGMTYTFASVLLSSDFPFHKALPDIADVTYCWSARGPFSLLRLRGYWRASLYPGQESLEASAEQNRIRDWLAYIHPDAANAKFENVHPYRVHERCVDRLRVGRILLAGDAAHLNPPSGGMGMNGGIHDAVNLTEKLIRVFGGEDPALLDLYEAQRLRIMRESIIPQASDNRARMASHDVARQQDTLAQYRARATDPVKHREFLLRASMISALESEDSA